MAEQFIITNYQGGIFAGVANINRLERAYFFRNHNESIEGNIYLAKVNNIVTNINAAFVDFAPSKKAFVPLGSIQHFITTNRPFDGTLKAQDTVLIQIEKDAVKTKDPFGTGNLSLSGQFCVISLDHPGLSISKKIGKKTRSILQKSLLSQLTADNSDILSRYGVIIRTNAQAAVDQDESVSAQILEEIHALSAKMDEIIRHANHRTCYSVLYQKEAPYIELLKKGVLPQVDRITTDVEEIYEHLKHHFATDSIVYEKLHFYQDERICLANIYSLNTRISELLNRTVWLKSGGNLVIDELEAMTVIDVNSAKITGKKDPEETFLKVNLEACEEIAHQLIVRNLSGIIMIDFINMRKEESNQEMLNYFSALLKKDPVTTKLVDLTPLGIVEVTRKRQQKTFREQFRNNDRT